MHAELLDGSGGVLAHPSHTMAAQAGVRGGDPPVDPAPVVSQTGRISGCRGVGEDMRMGLRAAQGLDQHADDGDLRISPGQPPVVEPREPAEDGVDPAGPVDGCTDPAEQRAARSASPAAWAWSRAAAG